MSKQLPPPNKFYAITESMQQLAQSVEQLTTALAQTNSTVLKEQFEESGKIANTIIEFHANHIGPNFADDIANLRSVISRCKFPVGIKTEDLDYSERRVRSARGNILADLDDVLEISKNLGLEPSDISFSVPDSLTFEKAGYELMFEQLTERLTELETDIGNIRSEGEAPDASPQQSGLVNFYVKNVNVEISLAKLEATAKLVVDFISLARTIENISELTRNFVSTVRGVKKTFSTNLKTLARRVTQTNKNLITSVRTIAKKGAQLAKARAIKDAPAGTETETETETETDLTEKSISDPAKFLEKLIQNTSEKARELEIDDDLHRYLAKSIAEKSNDIKAATDQLNQSLDGLKELENNQGSEHFGGMVRDEIEAALANSDIEGALNLVLEKLRRDSDGPPSLDALRSEQDYWYELALNNRLMLEMDLAIALAQHNVGAATNDEDQAMCQYDLGLALAQQAARIAEDRGLKLLEDAVINFRAVLKVYTKKDMPEDWAAAQNNLGNVLQDQGTRSGGEKSIKLLDDAVTAYRAALEVYNEEDMPINWATTQNNLGVALQVQSNRSGGEKGIKLLDDAVTAYRTALKVRTKEDVPTDWAMTQNNLANALLAQQSYTSSEKKSLTLLGDAITAYHAALEVRTQEDMPLDWAVIQKNLGDASLIMADLNKISVEKISYLEQTSRYYQDAMATFHNVNMPYYYNLMKKSLDAVETKLAALRDDSDDSIDA